MVRRKRKQEISLLMILGAVFCIYVSIEFITNNLPNIILLAVVIGVIVLLAIVIVPRRNRRRLFDKVDAVIEQHADQLRRRRVQLVRDDGYGKPLLERWHGDIDRFITNHICPSLTNKEQSLLENTRGEIARRINMRAEHLIQQEPVFKAFTDDGPKEFEAFCAEQLRSAGWDAQLTAASGDQGVDVIAEKEGLRVVLQCKLYSGSVGNSAIQEIVAGKAFERAHCCAVVTNNRYTPAAEQLASANHVLLLHYSDLSHLETLLLRNPTAPSAPPSVSLVSFGSPETPAAESPNQTVDSINEPSAGSLTQHPAFLLKVAAVLAIVCVMATGVVFVREKYELGKIESRDRMQNSIPFTTYANSRFGFRIDYPDSFQANATADSRDGITLTSADSAASLVVVGANNDSGLSTKDYYENSLRTVSGKLGYQRLSNSWFVVTWTNDRDQVVYQKMFVGSGSHNSFIFTFPRSQRSTYERVVTRIEKSFRPGVLEETR